MSVDFGSVVTGFNPSVLIVSCMFIDITLLTIILHSLC